APYQERPKERPAWRNPRTRPQRAPPAPAMRCGRPRPTTVPDRSSCSGGCKTASPAIPSAPGHASSSGRLGNVSSSSSRQVLDFVSFAELFLSLAPPAPPLSELFAVSVFWASFAAGSSALAALL